MAMGNWEKTDSNDNWVAGWEGSPILTPAGTTGVTMGEGSLQVDWTGKYWVLTWNAPAVPTIEDGTKLRFDMTAFGADFADWAKVADKIALNSDGASGWKEYTSTTAIDRTTGLPTGLDFGSWDTEVDKTYTLDISDYDLTGATFFQVNISLQANPDGVGAGRIYLDNAWIGKPLPKLHVDGNKIKDANSHVVVLRGVAAIDIGMIKEWYGIGNYIDRITKLDDPNGTSPGWYPKVIRYVVCPNDSDVTDSPLVFNPNNPDDPNNEAVYDALKTAVDYTAEKGAYSIICLSYKNHIEDKIAEANAFWSYMAPKFANDNNVLFELFNEPTNDAGNWTTVKGRMQALVNLVRASAPNNLILATGGVWAQEIGPAATSPIDDDNLVYTAHCYPATWISGNEWITTQNITACAAVHPVIVTIWGFDPDPCQWCYSTVSEFGQPFVDYLEGLGVGSTPGLASNSWHPSLFDPNWQLLCGDGEMGCFVKDWLYEKKDADRLATLTITKCKVTAGKVAADGSQGDNDSLTMSGTFGNIALDFSEVTEIDVNISSSDGNQIYYEAIDCNSSRVSKGKFGYKYKIPKGSEGAITALTIDPVKRTFAMKMQKVDLTGLACPVQLQVSLGYYILTGEVSEAIVNGKKSIPTRLMRTYKDTLIVSKAKAKNSTSAASDTLSVSGEIAVAGDVGDSNLAVQDVNVVWGDQTFTIPAGELVAAKTGNSYKCSKVTVSGEFGQATAKFDLDKCTFTISMKGADLDVTSGDVTFGINFTDFDETADITLP
jgi:hypothetical protein